MINQITYEQVSNAINEWAKCELHKLGAEYNSQIPVYMQLNNFLSKRIPIMPRKVSESTNFKVPTERIAGYEKLKNALINGEDVNPYMSRKLYDSNFADGLLDHYDCFHFHLGEEMDGKFIKGNDEIALGIVNNQEVFFIQVKTHGKSTWNNIDVLEIVHEQRPDLIARFKVTTMVNISPSVSDEKDIITLREKGYSFAVTLKDGTSYTPSKFGQVMMRQDSETDVKGKKKRKKKKSLHLAGMHLAAMQYETRKICSSVNEYIKRFKLHYKCTITNIEIYELKGDNNSQLTQFKLKIFYLSGFESKYFENTFNFVTK
ncbi:MULTISPECIES: hypothetical protein [Acinetobacter]|uniref:Uncharacterized protein n=1 Tax=Acinetobacter higginsii TaxID=70347 RepID=N9RI15_9GAMM|nr:MULTISPECIES: hypothetical protein [Acinetobacter]ENX57638.1 hypothetical protein F902_02035 [Acinetobacter higginsii]